MTRFSYALAFALAFAAAKAQAMDQSGGLEEEWTPPQPRAVSDQSSGPKPSDHASSTDGGSRKSGAPQAEVRQVDPLLVGLLSGLGIGLLGFGIYRLVVEPKRKRRPLVAALELIARNDRAQLPEAARLLADALTLGLRRRDVATARFHLSYVRAQLNQYAEAAAVLADLPQADLTKEVVYLDLWLQSKLRAHDRVEAIYRDHAPLLEDLFDTKTIVGIAYLERARTFWVAKQISSAVDFFNKLRGLGVLLDEIPEHIDDHQVVLGVAALFEKNPQQAEKHFRGAIEATGGTNDAAIAGRLGVLLCIWTRDQTPDIEKELAQIATELSDATPTDCATGKVCCTHTNCRHEFRVSVRLAGKRVICSACRRGFRVPSDIKPVDTPADEVPLDRLLGEDELLLRNVLLWRVVSLLFHWRTLPPGEGLPEEERVEFARRLDLLRHADPTMADPGLLEGLVAYYFVASEDDEARSAAVALLEKAIKEGANVPEVIDLVRRENRVSEHRQHGLERFFAHVRDYIGDGNVPVQYREDMWARLNRSKAYKRPPKPDPMAVDGETPSLTELQARSQVLRDRVYRVHKQLVQHDSNGEDAQAISGLVGELEKNTQELLDTAARVQEVEHDLMASTSEFLLKEDQAQSPADEDQDQSPADAASQG